MESSFQDLLSKKHLGDLLGGIYKKSWAEWPPGTDLNVTLPNLLEHFISLYSGKPEAVSIGVIIAGALSVAFDERSTAELFEAGTGRGQGLAGALSTRTGML